MLSVFFYLAFIFIPRNYRLRKAICFTRQCDRFFLFNRHRSGRLFHKVWFFWKKKKGDFLLLLHKVWKFREVRVTVYWFLSRKWAVWPDMKIDQLRPVNFLKASVLLMPRSIWTRFSLKVLKKMNILSLPFWNRLRSHILLPNWFPPLRFGLSCGDFPGGPGKPRTPRFLGDPAGLLFLFVPVSHFSRGSLGNLVSQEFPVVQAGLEVLQDPMTGRHSNRRPINDMVVIKRKKIMTILFFLSSLQYSPSDDLFFHFFS